MLDNKTAKLSAECDSVPVELVGTLLGSINTMLFI